MTDKKKAPARAGQTKKIASIALIALAAVLAVISVTGFAFRGTASIKGQLHDMRTASVLHAASGGIVDSIVLEARRLKLLELRARPDFRKMGGNEKDALVNDAGELARVQAEAQYGDVHNADTERLLTAIEAFSDALDAQRALEAAEKADYAKLYIEILETVPDWTDFTGELEDGALLDALKARFPALAEAKYAHLEASFVKLCRAQAANEKAREDTEAYDMLYAGLCALVTDWAALAEPSAAGNDALWAGLEEIQPILADNERFRDKILSDARKQIEKVQNGETPDVPAAVETAVTETEITANYAYFIETDALKALDAALDTAFDGVWDELTLIIPDLASLDRKTKAGVRETIEDVVYSENLSFSDRYEIYSAQKADSLLTGFSRLRMQLAASAGIFLIAAIAVLLLALVILFWGPCTRKLGVPRTIITLFFIYLCLAAELYNINVPMMLGNVLERVGMYGILVLAMLPGIQCGIGLNMGMTIGCISGLLATVMALQYNLTGVPALAFACSVGLVIAMPLGWAYSKLLNRMKGNEMTISTYVGFSFVSLMCIGWMLLPFDNPKIIWLLCGKGLRVTHSLLGSFAHILDDYLAFDLFGADIPTGLLLFFLVCCGIMWLFSRSSLGIAMTAAGSNPRFAEASGINVNRMRTVGTVLSTMIAAVGIVIYSQAFGYAQLYGAPRQLGFIAASAILIGGATVSKAKVGHVLIGVFLFQGVLALGQQIANAAVAGGGLSEVMRIMISNGIILYALTQSGGATRD